MSITYSVTRKNGQVSKYEHTACYFLWYNQLEGLTSIDVFVDKMWMAGKPGRAETKFVSAFPGWTAFTSADYIEYVRLLNVMGFKISVREEEKEFIFTIPMEGNKIIPVKILLNAVRYLCEFEYPGIVKAFLRYSKEKVFGVNLYTKFLIAHYYTYIGHGGHTFLKGHLLALPINNDRFKREILDNNTNTAALLAVSSCSKPFFGIGQNRDSRKELIDLYAANAPFKEIYKKYKELCVKFT